MTGLLIIIPVIVVVFLFVGFGEMINLLHQIEKQNIKYNVRRTDDFSQQMPSRPGLPPVSIEMLEGAIAELHR